jgi:hypothetical protein
VKNESFGVPLEGGPSDAFTRERASATPLQPAPRRNPPGAFARRESREPTVAVALRPLQEWTARAIMDERAADDVERVVLPSPRLSSGERLDIYRQAYRARLVECLADDYPVLQHALGKTSFESLCHAYIDRHPSRSPNLNFFGRHMAGFCREAGWSGNERADLSADLATLEWAMVEVLHAAPAARLSLDELASVAPAAWARARFTPSATVRVFEFGYPVGAYLQSVRIGEEPEVPGPGWSATAVFRDGATIWRMDLSRAMHTLLRSLFQGDSLGTAFDALATTGLVTDEQGPEVMRWFRDWVGHGIFGAISVSPELA